MSDHQVTTPSFDAEELRKKYEKEKSKRLRRDGEGQYMEAAGEFEDFVKDPYVKAPLERDPVTEDVEVAIIGAGFGGLITAIKLRKAGVKSFRMIDEAGDFGGTWYYNRYPGIRCDIESLVYLPYLEEIGIRPKEHYAHGAEIYAHCQTLGRHFDLYKHALFETKATNLAWDEELSRWIIKTSRGDVIRARFVTVSQGPLSKVKLPGIPGIKRFKGKMFHSSRWDYGYTGGDTNGGLVNLATKKVGIIGTGATAVQIIPIAADYAKELYVFQRTPTAVDVRNNRPIDPDWYESLPKGWQQDRMNNFLALLSHKQQDTDLVHDQWTDYWKRIAVLAKEKKQAGSDEDPLAIMQQVDYQKMEELRARIDDVVDDPETAEKLKPWYNYLCKRPLFSDNYLEAFNKPNVFLVDTDGAGVTEITEKGVVANGREYELDCLIFATGFDVAAAAYKVGGYDVVGREGLHIDDKWSNNLKTVHGTQLHGFPNFHIVGGFLQGTTAFNFMHALDIQAEHAVDLIAKCINENIASMEVTSDAEDRWVQQMEENHNMGIQRYFEECTPGFLNNEGDTESKPSFLGGNFGGGTTEYERIIRNWRKECVEDDTAMTRLE